MIDCRTGDAGPLSLPTETLEGSRSEHERCSGQLAW